MSRIRLYMDEDSTARSLVLARQNRGVDVITSLILNSSTAIRQKCKL